jgi:drug/metabolite transporter (DMT)-like permease
MKQDVTAATAARSDSLKGIACLILGIAVFAIQDVVIKKISGVYPLHEAMVLRSLTAFPVLFLLVWRDGGFGTLTGPGWPWLLVRGVLAFVAYSCYYLGLAALPIATAVALYFAVPLFITVLSVLFLGERVGARRWAAVVIGFIGVFAIARPGTDLFEWAALLPITSAFLYAAAMVLTRRIGATETAPAMSTCGNGVFLLGALTLSAIFGAGGYDGENHRSLAFLMRGWTTPSTFDFLLMASCGVVAALALTLLTQAYRIAEANVVAPFEYTALIWSVLYGWLFWREWPDPVSWLGIVIIVGAGTYVFYREQTKAETDQARAVSASPNSP